MGLTLAPRRRPRRFNLAGRLPQPRMCTVNPTSRYQYHQNNNSASPRSILSHHRPQQYKEISESFPIYLKVLKNIVRPLLRNPSACSSHRVRRQFSALAICTSFPATLFRYSSKAKSTLYDRTTRQDDGDGLYEDAVEVSANGHVGPKPSNQLTLSNGALFMPNTFNVQELIRTNFDRFVDDEEAGKKVETPLIYTVPKGILIPSPLILFHETLERFSLQTLRQMPIQELNESLDEFYENYAEKQTAEEWLDSHDWNSAVGGEKVSIWMAQ